MGTSKRRVVERTPGARFLVGVYGDASLSPARVCISGTGDLEPPRGSSGRSPTNRPASAGAWAHRGRRTPMDRLPRRRSRDGAAKEARRGRTEAVLTPEGVSGRRLAQESEARRSRPPGHPTPSPPQARNARRQNFVKGPFQGPVALSLTRGTDPSKGHLHGEVVCLKRQTRFYFE